MPKAHPETLQALTSGIQAEVASYVFYVEAMKKSESEKIKDVLEKLAYEEKEHFHILERRFDSYVRSEKWNTTADVLRQPGLPEVSEEMSETHADLIREVEQSNSLKTILDIAYRLEKEANDIYVKARKTAQSEEARSMFEQLARFEEGHMNVIDDMRAEMLPEE